MTYTLAGRIDSRTVRFLKPKIRDSSRISKRESRLKQNAITTRTPKELINLEDNLQITKEEARWLTHSIVKELSGQEKEARHAQHPNMIRKSCCRNAKPYM